MIESDLQSLLPSLEVVQTALSMQPDHPELINMRGTVYLQLHQPELALADFEHATRLAPEYATAYFNWATTLHALGQLESALVCFDHALRIAPQFMQAWSNKGNTLHALNRLDEAVYCYDQALSCDPDSADVRWNKAHSLLLQGKFEQGWPLYESRWQTQGFSPRPLASTLWLGEASLENASIFVHAEQGLGDTLQFLRYLEPLIETGARVTLEVAASLKPLADVLAAGFEALCAFRGATSTPRPPSQRQLPGSVGKPTGRTHPTARGLGDARQCAQRKRPPAQHCRAAMGSAPAQRLEHRVVARPIARRTIGADFRATQLAFCR